MTHGGNPWPLIQAGFLKEEILDFSADLNPLGAPPVLAELLQEGVEMLSGYPDPIYREFRQAAGRFHRVDPECILPGNGSVDLIHLIGRWRRAAKAAVVVPAFTEYERAVQAEGGEVIPWFLESHRAFAVPQMNGAFPFPDAEILFLCNPNNPTGTWWPKEELCRLIELADSQRIWVVVDEAYLDFVQDDLRQTAIEWINRFPRLIVVRSMTKAFAVPGLRVGYLAAQPQVVRELHELQVPWAMNALAARVGSRLFDEEPFLAESRAQVAAWRGSFQQELRTLPFLRVYPSEANFFLLELRAQGSSALNLGRRLREQGILIRVCDDFRGLDPQRFVRLAVRRPHENERLATALKEVL